MLAFRSTLPSDAPALKTTLKNGSRYEAREVAMFRLFEIYEGYFRGQAFLRQLAHVLSPPCCHLKLGSLAGLSIHGGTRRNVEFCIMCHKPDFTESVQTDEPLGVESVHFKWMIHSLHKGEERATPTEIQGVFTEEVFFPGHLENCLNCHKPGTYTIPLPDGVLPTTAVLSDGTVISSRAPITAACEACHIGGPGFDAHADTMTSANLGEACAACHGRGREFDTQVVHRIHN